MTQASLTQLMNSLPDLLAPSMAKDHPNLPVVKAEGATTTELTGKRI